MGTPNLKDSGPYAPTKSATVADTENFSKINSMAQEYTFDLVYKNLEFNPTQFTTAASLAVGTGGLKTLVSGACTLAEINTVGVGGVKLTATNDQLAYSFVLPIDFDPAKGFGIRYEFVTPAGIKWTKATDLVTTRSLWSAWKLSTSTGALGATAMSDTTNTTSIPSVIYGRKWSDWDIVNDSAVVAAAVTAGDSRVNIVTNFSLGTNVTSIFVLSAQFGHYKRYQM